MEHRCVDFIKVAHYVTQPQVEFEIQRLDGIADLSKLLNLLPSDHFRLATKAMDRELDFFNRLLFHRYSTFLGIRTSQPVLYTSAQNPALRQSYMSYLQKKGRQAFVKRCGHLFVKEFSVTVERLFVVEIPAKSDVDTEKHRKLIESMSGIYKTRKRFIEVLEKLRFVPRAQFHDPFENRSMPGSKIIPFIARESLELHEQTSFSLAPFPVQLADSRTSELSRINNQRLLEEHLFEALWLRNNLLYMTRFPDEFVGVNARALAETIQRFQQRIRLIRQQGKRCSYASQKCLTELPEIEPFDYPTRVDRERAIPDRPAVCETPIYNEGQGASCGVESYTMKRSKYCGVELYKEKKHRRCPGFEPPGGPSVLRVEATPCQGRRLTIQDKSQLDEECTARFGRGWIFSDVTEQYTNKPLSCPPGATMGDSKTYYRCVKLARINSCRHPKHGVERYRECAHPAHGIAAYRRCRSPEFGIRYFEATHCPGPSTASR